MFEQNIKWFKENKQEIEQKYGRKTYVVIHNEKILGSGEEKFALARKFDPIIKGAYVIMSVETSERIGCIDTPFRD